MNSYRITNDQRAYLDSLVCQRISDDETNRAVIDKFSNDQNFSLPYALKNGWGQDRKDKVAYYIVKEPGEDAEPLLFFSLKCGELFVPFNRDKLQTALDYSAALLDAAHGHDAPQWAKDVVEKCKVDGKLPQRSLEKFLDRHMRNIAKWNDYAMEIQLEGENIIRTKKTMAAVELVHFCVHAPAVEKWKAMGMGSQGIGKTMFWKFVVPIIQQIRGLVGCEYIYLLAADAEKEGHLVNYYQGLGFEAPKDLYVNKPEYDFRCFFMCQKVTSLHKRQLEFFRSYNKSREPVKA